MLVVLYLPIQLIQRTVSPSHEMSKNDQHHLGSVLLNFSFSDVCFSEYPSSCCVTIWTSPQLITSFFAHAFSSKTCHNFEYFCFPDKQIVKNLILKRL